MREVKFAGDLGPGRVDEVRNTIAQNLEVERPQLRICLSDVGEFHLGIANVLVAARKQASERCGDINIVVARQSDCQRLLAMIGIVGAMTP